MNRIPVAGPWITDAEVALVAQAAREGWYTRADEWAVRFESEFATAVGRRYALALPSCTSAIHLVLASLGIGPGDEVIVPECTWIATAAPITYVGATPVFADIDPETWCICAHSVEARLTLRTRAVIAVDLYGGMPDYDALERLSNRHGLALIEDAAQGIGASWRGRPAGAFGVASCFSFHGSKTLTTGEGGMLVTDSSDLANRTRVLRDHGREPGDRTFFNGEVAFKYRMSALQAAMGVGQLRRLDELVAKKRVIFDWYRHALADLRALRLNAEPTGVRNAYWMSTAVLDPALGWDKAQLIAALDAEGIDTRPFFPPLSTLPAFGRRDASPVASRIARFGVNLPSALCLEREDVERVCAVLIDLLAPAQAA